MLSYSVLRIPQTFTEFLVGLFTLIHVSSNYSVYDLFHVSNCFRAEHLVIGNLIINFQGLTSAEGHVEVLDELTGQQLMGLALSAPLTSYTTIYTLPMLTILEGKGSSQNCVSR